MFRRLFILVGFLALTGASQADSTADLVTANNRFALKLMEELSAGDGSNVVFSPLSLQTALSMAFAGARGETASQIADALEISGIGEQVHNAQRALSSEIQSSCNSDTVAKFTVANATWSAWCVPNRQYSNLLTRDYDAQAYRLGKDPDESARMINDWAAEHTEQRIQQVVTPDMLDDQLAMVITNAVYFLGRWQYPFKAEDTRIRQFWVDADRKKDVNTMQQDLRAGSVGYLDADDFQALELPYTESTAALVIILPREKDGLAEILSKMDIEWLNQQLDEMEPRDFEIDLWLPKVKTQSKASVSNALKSLGMPLAFQPSIADFSGICGSPGDIYIDDVVHATFLDIDERGTEAAAVTAIMMGVTSAPMPREKIAFHCDHPFLFLIRDTETGAILFMGRIADPRS